MATLPMPGLAHDGKRLFRAAALAIVVEALLLGGGYLFLSRKPVAPPPVPITLLAIAQAPKPVPAPPKPLAPVSPPPVKPPPPVRRVIHHVVHTARPKPQPMPKAPAPPPPAPAPATQAAPPPVPQPPPPPAAPVAAAAPGANFASALRAAIQAALRYPVAARMGGMTGRTRVAFDYRDGVVSHVRVVISSGVGLLDRAALAAVREAAVPKPKPAFAGKTFAEQLWVTFNLNNDE
ncbi:MAG: TonB family protein [Burkholderiales bacterium]|nr:TonB family protein [Burkholderiales bacterium]MDE2609451.1 TonB family protein [Burkholderiales bacterium]